MHTGPRLEYGRILVEAEPGAAFAVECPRALMDAHQEFVRAAVFGVLDVVLSAEPYPLKNFVLRVVELQSHPIDSSQMAFRRAGQDAGRKLLREAGLVETISTGS